MQRAQVPFALAGDSAGGGLALSGAIAAAQDGPGARAIAVFSPWVDMTLTAKSLSQLATRDPIVSSASLQAMLDAYAPGQGNLRDPQLSPLFADLHNLPPMLIQVGSDEGLLDDAISLDRCASTAGGQVTLEVWPEMVHIWVLRTTTLPQANQALQRAGLFLREHFGD